MPSTERERRIGLWRRPIVIRGRRRRSNLPGMLVFSQIYQDHFWPDRESRSGPGSNLEQTVTIRQRIPELLTSLGAASLLDVPCGDFNWMRQVSLGVKQYIGADVVPDIIDSNQRRFAAPGRQFLTLDAAEHSLPQVDLVFCRDLLVHLSFNDAFRVIANFQRSSSTYLLVTTFPAVKVNRHIETGGWRPLNLQLPPFAFPEPMTVINEGCTEGKGRYADKSLGLWRLADLPVPSDENAVPSLGKI